MGPMDIADEGLLDLALDHSVRWLREARDRRVAASATHESLRAALYVPTPEEGEDAASVIEALARGAQPGLVASIGPRYFGFVIGGSLPVTLAADWLTSAWDQNAGLYATAPSASVVEEIVREWLLDMLDLPRDASVGFVTGGQMANTTALAAARNAVLARAGWDVEELGIIGAPRINLVVTAETHVTIKNAMRTLGFGTKSLLPVETDGNGRMRVDAMKRLFECLTGPTIVCVQAGNVNTGAIDPIAEIVDLAHEHGAWVHVDGAIGLWGLASERLRPLMAGIERADSWSTDAHKWLNVPYDSGIVIVRDAAAHRNATSSTAAYLIQSSVERDPTDWTPEFSRRARAFPTYAALRHLGRRGVAALTERCCDRAKQMASLLRRDEHVTILNDVVLNQVLVRFSDSDELTRATVLAVQDEGTCWLGGTTWHGVAAMRISFSNWLTTEEDVERSAKAILACARRVWEARGAAVVG